MDTTSPQNSQGRATSLRTTLTIAVAVGAGALLSFCSAPVDHAVGLAPSIELRSLLGMPMSTIPLVRPGLVARLRDVVARFTRRRLDSLHDLDLATLADIGVHASEITSIDSEWRGRAAVTRRRIAIGLPHA